MQIGLAETPTMHGGIASVEVGFTQCTFFLYYLTSTHAYAYNALPLTSFCSLPMYIIVTHRRKEPLGEQGGRRTLRPCNFIPLMLAVEAPSLETVNTEMCKKGDRGKSGRRTTGQGDGANQRGKFCAARRAAPNGVRKRLARRFLL